MVLVPLPPGERVPSAAMSNALITPFPLSYPTAIDRSTSMIGGLAIRPPGSPQISIMVQVPPTSSTRTRWSGAPETPWPKSVPV